MNNYQTGGPRTFYKYGTVRCCRIWPIITSIILVSDHDYKEIPQWYRNCGACGSYPQPVQEGRP